MVRPPIHLVAGAIIAVAIMPLVLALIGRLHMSLPVLHLMLRRHLVRRGHMAFRVILLRRVMGRGYVRLLMRRGCVLVLTVVILLGVGERPGGQKNQRHASH